MIEVSATDGHEERGGARGPWLDGRDVHPITGRLMSIAQLQQVLRAQMQDGAPGPNGESDEASSDITPRLSNGVGRDRADGTESWPSASSTSATATPRHSSHITAGPGPLPRPYVLVIGAQPGDGCSVTALALAEAASQSHQVHLVEAPRHSDGLRPSHHVPGLLAVTEHELGIVGDGWQRGRRGDVIVDRVPVSTTVPEHWPPAAPATTLLSAQGLLVVDGGALTTTSPWWSATVQSGWPNAVVLVCRPTVASITAAQEAIRTLQQLHPMATVAVTARQSEVDLELVTAVVSVGGTRWRGPVAAAAEPVMARMLADQRVIGLPITRSLSDGPSTAPLPRAVSAAGRHVWELLAERPTNQLDGSPPSFLFPASPFPGTASQTVVSSTTFTEEIR
ncbi:hypothetical protein LWF15_11320 [Kineosporia rhizophila]|uniref:hypothetical protein n=1 Tax=Kineosporia rhizophila TaxID=84633 RepID=UPI001E51897B|nr:hypothetical protein [Kineosporia rhizophila]MCE0536100.1 hypothetical protein [Kineosporia rhizophila]